MSLDIAAVTTFPLIGIIKLYKRFISPSLPDSCIYHPSCSSYAIETLRIHGLIKGSVISSFRIISCNPFAKGGLDPVHKKGTPLFSSIRKNTANIEGENG